MDLNLAAATWGTSLGLLRPPDRVAKELVAELLLSGSVTSLQIEKLGLGCKLQGNGLVYGCELSPTVCSRLLQ